MQLTFFLFMQALDARKTCGARYIYSLSRPEEACKLDEGRIRVPSDPGGSEALTAARRQRTKGPGDAVVAGALTVARNRSVLLTRWRGAVLERPHAIFKLQHQQPIVLARGPQGRFPSVTLRYVQMSLR
jgi:hypothetical protein